MSGIALPSSRLFAPAPAGDLAFQFQSGEVVIEAESFHNNVDQGSHSWDGPLTAQAGYSGSGYMQALPNSGTNEGSPLTNAPYLEYRINFPSTGDYFLFVHAYGASGSDDSFYWTLDGSGTTQQNVTSGSWQWEPGDMPVSSTGVLLFRIYMREDGMIIDKIVINDDETEPTGTGPSESPQA